MAEVICTATIRETRRYTVTLYDDAGGSALDIDTDIMTSGVAWGETQREARPGILPSTFDFELFDPDGIIEARVTGQSGPQDLPVVIERADGGWIWYGFVRPQPRRDTISPRVKVRTLSLTATDGLDLLSDTVADLRGGALSSVGGAFHAANADLDVYQYLATTHNAGRAGDDLTDLDITSIGAPDRYAKEIDTWGDMLEDVCKRYNAVAFLDPTDLVSYSIGLLSTGPRWRLEHVGTLGLAVPGVTYSTTSGGVFGTVRNETGADATVTVAARGLLTDGGKELRSAVTRRVDAALPEAKSAAAGTLILSAKNVFRDGAFEYKLNDNTPLYAESITADVTVATMGTIDLDPSGPINPVFVSEDYFVSAPLFARLTYDASLKGSGSTMDVTLRLKDDDTGATLTSVTGGVAANGTLDLDVTEPGRLSVRVDTDEGRFGNATLALYTVPTYLEEDEAEHIVYRSPGNAFLTREVDPLADWDLTASFDTVDSVRPVAPCSEYTHDEFPISESTAVAYSAAVLRALRPSGAQTLLVEYVDATRACLSPRTRLAVTRQDGSVSHFVIGGGRRTDLRTGITEIADIETPITSLS
jgi:hypothetical protein